MTQRVTLDGANVKNASVVREAVLEALQGADQLSLDIAGDGLVDLCGVQLIESARLFAAAAGKTIVLERPATGFADVLRDGGFILDASADDLRFWFHQEITQ